MFPYEEPTVESADKIDEKQKIIDTDFTDLKTKFDKVNDVLSEQKKPKKIEDTVEDIFKTDNFDDFWWEEDLFDKTDSTETINASKRILENIQSIDNRMIQEIIGTQFIPIDDRTKQELKDDDYPSFESENKDDKVTIEDVKDDTNSDEVTITDDIKDDFNIDDFKKKTYQPVDNRTIQEIIDDQFIPTDDRTQQELEDDDYLSFESENKIYKTSAWDNKTTISKPGPIYKLSTDYNKKIRAAKKIYIYKCIKKKIGAREKSNKISAEWLKTAGYLNTKDQDKINYIFIPPKKEKINSIPADAGHFIRSETDSTDFKKENLASKKRKEKIKKPYINLKEWRPKVKDEIKETIDVLDEIASLNPGKNVQIAAKKISEKYKKIRDAKK